MRVLVTGGAGYIGSHIVRLLQARGHGVVVLDDLQQGHREAIPEVALVEGDIADGSAVRRAWEMERFDSVVHLAASCQVGESMLQPELYYRNNLIGSLSLLEHVLHLGVTRMVFSSSAATYGEPEASPITEEHPTLPTNPYGETKLAFEKALEWHRLAHGVRSISLRYFNAAGAAPGGVIGEDHDPETHLLPLLMAVALGQTESIQVFGSDYPTPDGTCVRDYVHVDDLGQAHLLALEALEGGLEGGVFNVGSENGYSVREVIEMAREVTGESIPVEAGARRPGDPPSLVASSRRIRDILGWRPEQEGLAEMLRTAWEWHRRHPAGFAKRSPTS